MWCFKTACGDYVVAMGLEASLVLIRSLLSRRIGLFCLSARSRWCLQDLFCVVKYFTTLFLLGLFCLIG